MLEKELTSKLLRTLRTKLPNSWWYKIPDPSRCPACGVVSAVNKRPFDLVGCVGGHFVAIEVKVRSTKDLKPHQRSSLAQVLVAGGHALVQVSDETFIMVSSATGNLEKAEDKLEDFLDVIYSSYRL